MIAVLSCRSSNREKRNMQTTRIKRILVATIAGVVTATGFVAAPSAAWAASIQLTPAGPLRQADVAGSVDYLTSTFGVTVAEAMPQAGAPAGRSRVAGRARTQSIRRPMRARGSTRKTAVF